MNTKPASYWMDATAGSNGEPRWKHIDDMLFALTIEGMISKKIKNAAIKKLKREMAKSGLNLNQDDL